MKSRSLSLKTQNKPKKNGFAGMSELVIAAGTGTLLIMASGMALRSTGTLIKQTETKATLRQNSINGLRLLRSEVERSMHLIINKTESFDENQSHINMSDERYTEIINECKSLAGERQFQPIFGVKMIKLSQPIIYGMSLDPNSIKSDGTKEGMSSYSIERCGAPLNPDGKYNETSNIFLSRIIESIGAIPCRKENELKNSESLASVCEEDGPSRAQILSETDFTFTAGKTPKRTERQPALRVETDTNYKLVKFIDPTEADDGQEDDAITRSFINKLGVGDRRVTYQPLYFTAFARADKRVDNFGEEGQGGPLNGAFFQNITSSNVRFVIDGSGSMSACVMWGEGHGSWRTFYDPKEGRYRDTKRICALTRMEALISEMTMILEQLPNNTKIGLTSFSSNGYGNHKEWDNSKKGLVRLGNDGMRDSAIQFVNTLDNAKVTKWGGTDPWNAIQSAFNDTEADTLYLMSDGRPNRNRDGDWWSSSDHEETAEHYAGENVNRQHAGVDRALIVNATSLGLDSPWLEKLAELTKGYYNQIDKESLTESNPSNS